MARKDMVRKDMSRKDMLAVVAIAALAGGCWRELDRPLSFEPHVYHGYRTAALSGRQVEDLEERARLQR